jgi:hypothetical protein
MAGLGYYLEGYINSIKCNSYLAHVLGREKEPKVSDNVMVCV